MFVRWFVFLSVSVSDSVSDPDSESLFQTPTFEKNEQHTMPHPSVIFWFHGADEFCIGGVWEAYLFTFDGTLTLIVRGCTSVQRSLTQ